MNRWDQRQSITFRSVCTAVLTGSAVLGTWGISPAPAWAEDPVATPGRAVADQNDPMMDELKELLRKLGGNPGTLSPQPKAAMAEIMQFWEENGLPPFANKLSILTTASQLQLILLTRPGDLEPETVAAFMITLNEIIDATKLF